jgi:hypothetical protein
VGFHQSDRVAPEATLVFSLTGVGLMRVRSECARVRLVLVVESGGGVGHS